MIDGLVLLFLAKRLLKSPVCNAVENDPHNLALLMPISFAIVSIEFNDNIDFNWP